MFDGHTDEFNDTQKSKGLFYSPSSPTSSYKQEKKFAQHLIIFNCFSFFFYFQNGKVFHDVLI